MFVLVDNYDSFTWNLWHFLSDLGAEVTVIRNDACDVSEILNRKPQGVVISPGPGLPKDAGISIDLVKACHTNGIPLLGVCLGHQALAVAFGGKLKLIDPPVHGKLSNILRTENSKAKTDIFAYCPVKFTATRYHSLAVEKNTLPNELAVTAQTEAGLIMGLSHISSELHGVQFHPESIATDAGYRILERFLEICGSPRVHKSDLEKLEAQTLNLLERFPGQIHT